MHIELCFSVSKDFTYSGNETGNVIIHFTTAFYVLWRNPSNHFPLGEVVHRNDRLAR